MLKFVPAPDRILTLFPVHFMYCAYSGVGMGAGAEGAEGAEDAGGVVGGLVAGGTGEAGGGLSSSADSWEEVSLFILLSAVGGVFVSSFFSQAMAGSRKVIAKTSAIKDFAFFINYLVKIKITRSASGVKINRKGDTKGKGKRKRLYPF